MTNFIVADRKTAYLMPPSVEDWVSEDHLARFVVEIVDGLDISNLINQYAGRGSKAYNPATLLALIIYGYATGVFSSRKLERATYDSVAFRYIAANSHPDHDTLATFRRRFLPEIQAMFVEVLEMAKEMKILQMGTVCLDGTKIHANASRHSALSHGHIIKLQAHLKKEVDELLALAEKADTANIPDGMNLPKELKLREDRLAVIQQAKEKISARAAERYKQEKAEFDEKTAEREAKEKATGKEPKEPEPGPRDTDQINLTDEESRIMPVAGVGFEQCYNAQAAVDAPTMLIIGTGLTQATNDKEQVKHMVETLKALPESIGAVKIMAADTGYCSEKNITLCEENKIEAVIAVAREDHHPGWADRFTEPAPLPENATPMQKMAHKLKTIKGRATYALRKQTVEPVFGIIKSVMGFRQFSMRGLKKVSGEWDLVCLAWNVKRMAVLRLKVA